MLKNVFFDLDGTLVDCKPRLYGLFQDLVPVSKFSFQEYCEIKSQRMDQKRMLETFFNFTSDQIAQFKIDWLNQVETPERLAIDKPIGAVSPQMFAALSGVDLYVVTNRQYQDRTMVQLKNLGLLDCFKQVLVTEQKDTKAQLIKRHVPTYSPSDIIIGDTGEDIRTGQDLGIKTIAVESGVLNREILSEYKPDFIINNVEVFCDNPELYC